MILACKLSIALADFGLAHQMPSLDPAAVEKLPASALAGNGPRRFIPPEALSGGFGAKVVTCSYYSSDVYVLGGFMFEVLSGGREPWHWLSEMQMRQLEFLPAEQRKHLLDDPKAMACIEAGCRGRRELKAQLVDLVRDCLALNPSDRPTIHTVLERVSMMMMCEDGAVSDAVQ